MSLVARYLENSGIPTVVVGSALDIIEHVGVHAICIQISLWEIRWALPMTAKCNDNTSTWHWICWTKPLRPIR